MTRIKINNRFETTIYYKTISSYQEVKVTIS